MLEFRTKIFHKLTNLVYFLRTYSFLILLQPKYTVNSFKKWFLKRNTVYGIMKLSSYSTVMN